MTWKPGWVRSVSGEARIEVGQVWTTATGGPLVLTIVGHLPSGEVVFRPTDPSAPERLFPLQDVTHDARTGQPLKEHLRERACPFFWVDADRAEVEGKKIKKLSDLLKAAKEPAKAKAIEAQLAETFPYVAGDLLAHEAWDVWTVMVMQ